MKRIAIVGSRYGVPTIDIVKFVRSLNPIHHLVVSGGARGVDMIAANEAQRIGLDVVEFLPEWDRLGRKAAFVRNRTIVANADELAAFHYRNSRGTAHSIRLAHERGIPVHCFDYS